MSEHSADCVNRPQITERVVFDWVCCESRCGRRGTTASYAEAEKDSADHLAFHAASKAIGPTLEGLVWDTEKPGQYIDDAVKGAIAAGFSFIAFNGRVMPVGRPNVDRPICRADDVPGLRS